MIVRVIILFAAICGAAYAAELATLGQITYYDQSGNPVPAAKVCDTEPAPVRGITALREHMYYPPWERSLRVGGTVRVSLSLDSAGKILESRIVESARPKFDDIVLTAVRKTEWKPASKNGKNVQLSSVSLFILRRHANTHKTQCVIDSNHLTRRCSQPLHRVQPDYCMLTHTHFRPPLLG